MDASKLNELMGIITKFFAGYDFEETHGHPFRKWFSGEDDPDPFGCGRSYCIPVTIYLGEAAEFFMRDNEIWVTTTNREEFINSYRAAWRYKDGHEAIREWGKSAGFVVPDEFLLEPSVFGPPIKLGQIWESVQKNAGKLFEVVDAQAKHVVMRRLDTGKGKPVRDTWLVTEYKLSKDIEGPPVHYSASAIVERETPISSLEETLIEV